MTDQTLLGIVGSVSADSRTRTAVEVALDAAVDRHDIETDVLHLADYDLATADGRGIDNYEGDTAEALELIVEADAYVVGTPVYRGSYSGALKNLLDMVPRGQWQGDVAPFENAAVGLVATGATDHHFLAVDQELRPAFAFFGRTPWVVRRTVRRWRASTRRSASVSPHSESDRRAGGRDRRWRRSRSTRTGDLGVSPVRPRRLSHPIGQWTCHRRRGGRTLATRAASRGSRRHRRSRDTLKARW